MPRSLAASRNKPRKPRGKGLRAKTGCVNCRSRHLKCDENRPKCRRCIKANQNCRYADNWKDTAHQLFQEIPAVQTLSTDDTETYTSPFVVCSDQELPGEQANRRTHLDQPLAQDELLSQNRFSSRETLIAEQQAPAFGDLDTLDRSLSIVEHQAGLHSDVDEQYEPVTSATRSRIIDFGFESQSHCENTASDRRPGPERHFITSSNDNSIASGCNGIHSPRAATSRWLSLLTSDYIPSTFELAGSSASGTSHSIRADNTPNLSETPPRNIQIEGDAENPSPQIFRSVKNPHECQLSGAEFVAYEHFVRRLSTWIDLTDSHCSFSTEVAAMALHNKGLLNAILAVSFRHLFLLGNSSITSIQQELRSGILFTQYYTNALRFLQSEMMKETYLRSSELLATVIIISTYEMMNDTPGAWERHLKGVFWIQNSQLIHGEYGGLKQAIWWAWLRQDIWAALREQRKILSYYQCQNPMTSLDRTELVNRSVFLLGQCVNFASVQEVNTGETSIEARVKRATFLCEQIDEWWKCFEPYYHELPCKTPAQSPFAHIWIHPMPSSCAAQMTSLAQLLLLAHQPMIGGLAKFPSIRRKLQEVADFICGIGCTAKDDSALLVSTQCVYIAGIFTENQQKREKILHLLRAYQLQIRWPVYDLRLELREHWDFDS